MRAYFDWHLYQLGKGLVMEVTRVTQHGPSKTKD